MQIPIFNAGKSKLGQKIAFWTQKGLNISFARNALSNFPEFLNDYSLLYKNQLYAPNKVKEGFLLPKNSNICWKVAIFSPNRKNQNFLIKCLSGSEMVYGINGVLLHTFELKGNPVWLLFLRPIKD